MKQNLTRRHFLASAGSAIAVATASTVAAEPATSNDRKLKILGIACSPRKGMSTAKAVQAALDAAMAVDASIETDLIDLGGLNITGYCPKPPQDDFQAILPKLQDPSVGGLIIGSPAYFRGLSALCKAFIERCAPLREPTMLLADKPVGVVAVGAFRNGGQELVIEQIQAAMLCFGMIPVGGHAPAFQGATLLAANDSIAHDELGLKTAAQLGKHVGEAAIKLAKAAATPARAR